MWGGGGWAGVAHTMQLWYSMLAFVTFAPMWGGGGSGVSALTDAYIFGSPGVLHTI